MLVAGSYVQVCNGTRAIKPVSFINNVDPAFSVPQSKHRVRLYDAAAFPFDKRECDSNGYHEWVAHFLCLAIKVSSCGNWLSVHVCHDHPYMGFKTDKDRLGFGQQRRKGLSSTVDLTWACSFIRVLFCTDIEELRMSVGLITA